MKSVGIICEYNPFHNGHLYHLREIKKMFPNSPIILILSGPFTERGDASILTKWEKTELALTYGIDLVIELPFIFATGSADLFAKGAITLLKDLQVSFLVFGSEKNNVESLVTLAQTQLNEGFQEEVKQLIATGINYPTALSKLLHQTTGIKINTPNDLLGISYIKSILELNANITPITIQRTNQYHDTQLHSSITSATSIRHALKKNETVAAYLPKESNAYLHSEIDIEKYFYLLKYKIVSEQDQLFKYHEVSEKIIPRLQKTILKSSSLDELIHSVKTKNETYSKLKRMFLFILCGVTKEEAQFYKAHPYIRILGFNEKGKFYLNQIKKQLTLPVITNYSNDKKQLLTLDRRINQIYVFPFEKKFQEQYLENDKKKKPIYKKESY